MLIQYANNGQVLEQLHFCKSMLWGQGW